MTNPTNSFLFGIASVLAALSIAPDANAAYNTVWIHGRTTSPNTPTGNSYWVANGSSIATGSNIIYANYNGNDHFVASDSNGAVVTVLNQYCTSASTPCVIACHSAGCAQIGLAVNDYYSSSTGKTPWYIYTVVTGGDAEGGSELAGNTAYFFSGENIDQDLAISNMRSSTFYNHDLLGDVVTDYVFDELGGDYASLTTCLFEGGCVGGSGQNDSAVSFQSSGRFRNSGTEGSDSARGQTTSTWWNYSYALTVDTHDTYGHCIVGSYPCEQGKNNGVSSLVASYISSNNL
jgi:hypothetical protein